MHGAACTVRFSISVAETHPHPASHPDIDSPVAETVVHAGAKTVFPFRCTDMSLSVSGEIRETSLENPMLLDNNYKKIILFNSAKKQSNRTIYSFYEI